MRYDSTGEETDVPFEAQFAGWINAMLTVMIEQCNIEHTNLIEVLKEQAIEQIKQTNSEKEKLNKKLRKFNNVISRITSGNKVNKINNILNLNITDLKQKISLCDEQIKFLRNCEEIVSHHNYKIDEEPEQEANDFITVLTSRSSNRRNNSDYHTF